MKKFMFLLTVLLCVGWSGVVQAGTAGSLTLKNNWSDPQHGPGSFSDTVSLFLQTPGFLGLAGDFTFQPKGDYVAYAPFLTLNRGPHFLLLGYSADSTGTEFVQAGYWHVEQYAGLSVIADLRVYVATNADSQSFSDTYLEVGRSVTPDWKISLVADDVYSFDGAANTLLLGPIVCYKLSPAVSIFGRYLHAWSSGDAGSTQADKYRLGVKYSF